MTDLPPFQRLIDEHGATVHRYLAVAAGVDAEDCYQETVLAALRAYPRLRDASNLRGWLLRIARHKAIDAHRSRARRPLPVGALPDAAAPGEHPLPDDGLWAAVHSLPAGQRDAVVLRYTCDLPHADIGRALGCTPEAARRRVHDGLENLRARWTP